MDETTKVRYQISFIGHTTDHIRIYIDCINSKTFTFGPIKIMQLLLLQLPTAVLALHIVCKSIIQDSVVECTY
jgi:hypothetical protein